MAGARRLADEVRVGLDESRSTAMAINTDNLRKDPLDELWLGKPVRQHVKEFGALFAAIAFFVTAVKLYRGRDVSECVAWGAVGALFAALGYFAPNVLRPIWRGWMKMAHYMSIVMTTVVLSIAWCVGFLPIAFLVRVCGIKRIDFSYKSNRSSYWEKRDAKYDDFKRLELQY